MGSRDPGRQAAVRPLQRRNQPPLHIQQDPPLVGVVGDRLQDEIMIKVVEEPLDVDIDHPVGLPTPSPGIPPTASSALRPGR